MHRNSFIISILVLSGMLFLATAAYAVEGITLEPTLVHLTMKPGEIWRGTVSVSNDSDAAISLIPSTANLSRSSDDDTIELSEDIASRLGTLAAWLQPSVDRMTLGAREKRAIEFAIDVPENASPGAHKGLLVLTYAPPTSGENEISATVAVALGIDLVIVGQPNHHIQLQDTSVHPLVGTKAPVTVSGVVLNSGNTLPAVRMRAEVGRPWGEGVEIQLLPENGSTKIAPGTQTLYRGVWGGEGYLPFGLFKTRIIAQDSAGVYETSRYFILVPWQVLVGAVVAGFIIYFGRSYGPKLLRRRGF